MLAFVYNIQNGNGSFNPHDYRYFEYCFTCPFIVLDVCYAVEMPHKVGGLCVCLRAHARLRVRARARACVCARV